MNSPHPGTPDGSTCRPRPIDHAGGARALNLIEDSNTHPSVMIRYSTFLVDSFFPARFSNSRVTGYLTREIREFYAAIPASEIARIRVSTTHGIPARPIAIRSVNTLHVAPVRTPVRRARASLRLSRRSARAAAPVPKRGPLPACSVCRGQYVGVTGLCYSAPRRPGALTWPRAKRTMPAALCTSHSKAVP